MPWPPTGVMKILILLIILTGYNLSDIMAFDTQAPQSSFSVLMREIFIILNVPSHADRCAILKRKGVTMAIQEGKTAPAFTLPDQNGNKVALKDFRGKNVILFFYPKDNTSG
jgi:cytochrome oxidase Cu insertion factor (SCO1/SenC/PrrC family)